MEAVRTQQDVNASADVVWSVLQDGAQYCSWVPGVEEVDGGVEDRQSITLIKREGQENTRLHITATTNRRQMTWRAGPDSGWMNSRWLLNYAIPNLVAPWSWTAGTPGSCMVCWATRMRIRRRGSTNWPRTWPGQPRPVMPIGKSASPPTGIPVKTPE